MALYKYLVIRSDVTREKHERNFCVKFIFGDFDSVLEKNGEDQLRSLLEKNENKLIVFHLHHRVASVASAAGPFSTKEKSRFLSCFHCVFSLNNGLLVFFHNLYDDKFVTTSRKNVQPKRIILHDVKTWETTF
jgi:hypothetical protein